MSNNNFTLIIKHALECPEFIFRGLFKRYPSFRERENIATKEKLSLLIRSTASFRHMRPRFLRL